jgi:hypothetical protein
MAKKKAHKSSRKRVKMHEAPKSTRTSIFRAMNAVLRDHGVPGTVRTLHIATSAPSAAGGCPDGQVRRTVCVKQDDGTIVCEERCEPV